MLSGGGFARAPVWLVRSFVVDGGSHFSVGPYYRSSFDIASVTQTPWGGSTFKPPQLRLGQFMGLSFYIRAALPQIRVETLIGFQANYGIKNN